MIVRAVVLMLIAQVATAVDIAYRWNHDGMDAGGKEIPEELISFNLYVSSDGGEPVLLQTTTTNGYVWQGVPYGCHVSHVTAYRADAGMESEPSNVVERCVDENTDEEIKAYIPTVPGDLRGFFRWLR